MDAFGTLFAWMHGPCNTYAFQDCVLCRISAAAQHALLLPPVEGCIACCYWLMVESVCQVPTVTIYFSHTSGSHLTMQDQYSPDSSFYLCLTKLQRLAFRFPSSSFLKLLHSLLGIQAFLQCAHLLWSPIQVHDILFCECSAACCALVICHLHP